MLSLVVSGDDEQELAKAVQELAEVEFDLVQEMNAETAQLMLLDKMDAKAKSACWPLSKKCDRLACLLYLLNLDLLQLFK